MQATTFFENISSCRMVDNADFTDGIVALFDDTDASECLHEHEPVDTARFDIHRFVADCQAAMHYVDLHVADAGGSQVLINSLFDSGTQISILKASAVENLSYTVLGKVTLQTFDNRVSVGDLVSFDVKIDGASRYLPIRFVVCTNVSHDCLLSLGDYRRLLDVAGESGTDTEGRCEPTFGVANVGDQVVAGSGEVNSSDDGCDDSKTDDGVLTEFSELIDPNSSQVGELIMEQTNDKSLTGAFALARDGKGGYFLREGLLYHRAQIQGREVDRLVVPMCRRSAWLDLAHGQVGCHSRIHKTKQRRSLIFRWLTIYVCLGSLLEFAKIWSTESAPKSSKLMRWSLALAEYNIEFKYHPGKLNTAADSQPPFPWARGCSRPVGGDCHEMLTCVV